MSQFWRQHAMEPKQIDLYEFLVESELQQYYNSIKNELKISNASHLKYATDEDLKQIGLSRPEIRRLRKFYEKYYPHGYLSKIKRLLQNPNKKDDSQVPNQMSLGEPARISCSPSKAPSNKHIIPADSITVNKQLGTGEFGIVQQGVWTNGAERIQVAIKCLCRERMQSNPMEFLKEAAIMHAIEHENIVRLYGVVLDTDSLMLVTELAHLRSLLECLKDPGLRVSFLTVPTLCEFAMQICKGMMYLENKRLIHRDLAARNILVFSKNKVKISDFGLSRALGVGKDYYKTNFNVNLKLPIAWCAPECINYLRFTNASDVWAYAVCLWEMFSYGFQPWAALTGLQVLEAIDEPNYQRLEQPECCPKEYYNLMLKCWQHDPNKRPKFSEIYCVLPDIKPEQLKTIVNNCESKKEYLMYRQGEIITVLDKVTNTPYWKGVLSSGKTGLFNPANTVAYLEGLPSSTNRDSFTRTNDRSSKRKLRTEMISMPQNDLKHTGHVGIDGAYFGDVAFIASSQNYNHLPRQIVTPYKPSEDIEQTPLLLPPTPTSPDSLQTASGYFPEEITSSTNPTFINSNENTPKHQTSAFGSSFDFPPHPQPVFSSSNPFATTSSNSNSFAMHNNNYGLESNAFTNANLEDDTLQDCAQKIQRWSQNEPEAQHEYHEISDDEITSDKVFDLGPSLLDEINSMFGSINTSNTDAGPKSPNFENVNKKNEIVELTSKLNRKQSGNDSNGNKSKKKSSSGTVKNISVKDERILNHAIEIANEISARSMTDLVSDHITNTQSPKRKFSFRFPNLSHGSTDKDGSMNGNLNSNASLKERKNFIEELKSIPDLQRFRSLTEIEKFDSDFRIPLFDKESSDFCFKKSKEILSRPFNIEINTKIDEKTKTIINKNNRDIIGENLIDIENTLKALNLDFLQTYNDIDKTDSAETLFAEQYLHGVDVKLNKINNSTTQVYKNDFNIDNYGSKIDTNIINKNSKLMQHKNYANSKIYPNDIVDKLDDTKISIDPDNCLVSQETQRNSPNETHFETNEFNFSNIENHYLYNMRGDSTNCSSSSQVTNTTPVKQINCNKTNSNQSQISEYSTRQRSMSFTDNYDLKSPVLSEPLNRVHRAAHYTERIPEALHVKPRAMISYKPRSIKARTLRRLSYNPMILDSSTSSSNESDYDRSIAHSECDIRSKMTITSRKRRQYLYRKTTATDEIIHDKIYGSNTSIKSAPHYNYERYPGKYSNTPNSSCCENNFDDKIYDFGGRGPGNNYGATAINNLIKPPRAFAMNGTNYLNDTLYSEFDVTKLTGKSPTTQNFYPTSSIKDGYNETKSRNSTIQTKLQPQQQQQQQRLPAPGFQWPEKIHASTVKQNDLMWKRQQANAILFSSLKVRETFPSESSTSEADDIEFRNDSQQRIPPSPAP